MYQTKKIISFQEEDNQVLLIVFQFVNLLSLVHSLRKMARVWLAFRGKGVRFCCFISIGFFIFVAEESMNPSIRVFLLERGGPRISPEFPYEEIFLPSRGNLFSLARRFPSDREGRKIPWHPREWVFDGAKVVVLTKCFIQKTQTHSREVRSLGIFPYICSHLWWIF